MEKQSILCLQIRILPCTVIGQFRLLHVRLVIKAKGSRLYINQDYVLGDNYQHKVPCMGSNGRATLLRDRVREFISIESYI